MLRNLLKGSYRRMDMEIQEAITRIEKGFLVDANGDTTAKDFDALRVAISAMNELQKYHKLGTLEEVLEAVERNQEKLIANISKGDVLRFGTCPTCNRRISTVEGGNYCQNCGQKLDWSEVE